MTRREMFRLCGGAAVSVATLGAGAEAEGASRLNGLLQTVREKHGVPALAAAVIVNGKVKDTAAVGVRKAGDAAPAKVRDRFHLGSCTKAMTAVLIGMAVEEGKLDWGTRLDAALPDLAAEMHEEARAITVDHLLAHRSGLSPALHPRPSSLTVLAEIYRSAIAARRERLEFVRQILKEKPATAVGSAYAYCNAGYVVLGVILEHIWDAPWEALMRRRLFAPLGMRTGGFGAMGRPGKVEEPWQHRWRDGKPLPVEPGIFADNPPALGPAGTAHASVVDWAKFLTATIEGPSKGNRLLKAATWQRLQTPQFGGEYAGGWVVTSRPWGGQVLTHAGSNTMSFCVAWLAPEKRFGAAIMTNVGGDRAAMACDAAAAAIIGEYVKE